MSKYNFGRILAGDPQKLEASFQEFSAIPVDRDLMGETVPSLPEFCQTIENPVELSGHGTFSAKNMTTVHLEPTDKEGWWFERTDQPDELPVKVDIHNVWTTGSIVSNIVLRSGGPHNYIRMVEHIIAMRMGLGISNLMIRIDSGDPPLFDRGSLDLIEAFEKAGRKPTGQPARYCTVREKTCIAGPNGEFLILEPCTSETPVLTVDCAISFPNAIGKQRIKFPVTQEWMRYGALARTNTPMSKMIYCKTIGKIFADVRNLGYSHRNILIAGKKSYFNEPRLEHEGKALEAVWHRGVLDLLAAIALIEKGHFAGHITSFKSGHRLDVQMIKKLYQNDLLIPFG